MEWMQFDAVEPISIQRILLQHIAVILSTAEKTITIDDLTSECDPTYDEELDPQEAAAEAREEAMARAQQLLFKMIGINAGLGGHDLRPVETEPSDERG